MRRKHLLHRLCSAPVGFAARSLHEARYLPHCRDIAAAHCSGDSVRCAQASNSECAFEMIMMAASAAHASVLSVATTASGEAAAWAGFLKAEGPRLKLLAARLSGKPKPKQRASQWQEKAGNWRALAARLQFPYAI